MAVAEARAAWQRTANRCFVQEDAKRAPKLACCPSASASSKQAESGPTVAVDGKSANPALGFVPLNRTPSFSNLPPDSRWWLQLQPTHGYQRGSTNEQLNTLETDMETSKPEIGKKDSKVFGCSETKKESELYFEWIEAHRIEPWWRTTDRDELASLVARKSLDLIENCDLPRPQNTGVKRDRYGRGEFPASVVDRKTETRGSLHHLEHDPITITRINDSTDQKSTKEPKNSEHDPSKAQLLEALRHSQTRAREAEKAAKEAHEEKEHIIKLFFKQASHLFAYKQWLQLLQLESVYLHDKNKDEAASLPWMPHRNTKKAAKRKRGKGGQPGCDISKFAVAFALGLSLVSAGILLGWTVGWMSPTF